MITRDLYIRGTKEDPMELEDKILEDSTLALYIQQILMLLENENKILGAPGMNLNLEHYVFDTKISATRIKSLITSSIQEYCTLSKYYGTSVEVNIIKGTNRDICLVDIYVNKDVKLSYLVK